MRVASFAPTPDSAATLLETAEDDLRAALRGNPTPAQPLRTLSELFARAGRLEEALAFGARAYEEDRYLQDVDVTLLRLFQYSLELDRDAEAAAHCAEGRRRFDRPYFEDCHLVLMAWSDEVAPDPDSAWAAVERELEVYPAPLRPRLEPRLHALVASTLARTSRADSARAVLRRALADGEINPGLRLASAGVWALLGEPERALEQVDELLRGGMTPEDLARAPELRPLRGLADYEDRLEGG